MAGPAYWLGHTHLASRSIPIALYPATRAGSAIPFGQVHRPVVNARVDSTRAVDSPATLRSGQSLL